MIRLDPTSNAAVILNKIWLDSQNGKEWHKPSHFSFLTRYESLSVTSSAPAGHLPTESPRALQMVLRPPENRRLANIATPVSKLDFISHNSTANVKKSKFTLRYCYMVNLGTFGVGHASRLTREVLIFFLVQFSSTSAKQSKELGKRRSFRGDAISTRLSSMCPIPSQTTQPKQMCSRYFSRRK